MHFAIGVRGVKIPLRDRFWDKVNKNGPVIVPELGPCWPWMAGQTTNGYGLARGDAPRSVRCTHRAHRVAWELTAGVGLPPHRSGQTIEVRHRCDNRLCCNPSHLQIGTRTDNVIDMYERGRVPGKKRRR